MSDLLASYDQFEDILLGPIPGTHLDYAAGFGLLDEHPEILDMVGIPQSPVHHPEGDVFLHTMMVVNEAALLRDDMADGRGHRSDGNMALMFAALAHDFGKYEKTGVDGGKIHSRGHEAAGTGPARNFLQRIGAPENVIVMVEALVEHHLAPVVFPQNGAKAKSFRRLARKLADAGVAPDILARLATADQFGRTTEKAIARDDSDIRKFLSMMEKATRTGDPAPRNVGVVTGKMLIDRGYSQGQKIGRMIDSAYEIERNTGETDPDKLISLADGEKQ